jgi:hypothetical protein
MVRSEDFQGPRLAVKALTSMADELGLEQARKLLGIIETLQQ